VPHRDSRVFATGLVSSDLRVGAGHCDAATCRIARNRLLTSPIAVKSEDRGRETRLDRVQKSDDICRAKILNSRLLYR